MRLKPEDFAALPHRLSFTVDVEDHCWEREDTRYSLLTRRLMTFLEAGGSRGTFFVLGKVAWRSPDLVREIAQRGHEVASHGEEHEPLPRLTPTRLEADLARSRERLQALSSQPVAGFRAPKFSLTRRSAWAARIIQAVGFTYSASVLPAWSLSYGFPQAPNRPFRWPGGLLEIPCPVATFGPLRLPYLGGMYLRYLPPWRLRRMVRGHGADAIWTYCHPYDVDESESLRLSWGAPLASLFLSANRGLTMSRLSKLMQGRLSVPLGKRLDELGSRAPVFGSEMSPTWGEVAWRGRTNAVTDDAVGFGLDAADHGGIGRAEPDVHLHGR